MNLTPVRTPAWRRIMSFCLVLVLLAALVPASVLKVSAATPKKLFLQPHGTWKQNNERYAAYFFGNGEKWVSMSDSDGNGTYEVDVPSGYTKVIFCRMNGSASANNWDNKWDQTDDLVIPTDGSDCYSIKDWKWYSSFEKGTTLYFKPNSTWKSNSARFAAYFFVGDNYKWVSLTDSDNDGYYEVEVPGDGYTTVIFVRMKGSSSTNDWNNKDSNQTSDLLASTAGSNNCYEITSGNSGKWTVFSPTPVYSTLKVM